MARHIHGAELLITNTYGEWLSLFETQETQSRVDFGDGSFVCFDSLEQKTTADFFEDDELEANQDFD